MKVLNEINLYITINYLTKVTMLCLLWWHLFYISMANGITKERVTV